MQKIQDRKGVIKRSNRSENAGKIKTVGKDARNKNKFQGGLKPWQCQSTPTSQL
jgi:hypothetical protein